MEGRKRQRQSDRISFRMGPQSLLGYALLVALVLLGRPSSTTVAFVQPPSLGWNRQQPRTNQGVCLQGTRQVGDLLDLRLLLIDHYDSFTYNLVDMLGQHCVHPPLVVAADSSAQDVQRILDQDRVDGIILSPGPGNPPGDESLAATLIKTHPETPILGVCLGHQILGTVYGATCTQAPTPVHGQVHSLRFLSKAIQQDDLWQRALDLLSTGMNGDAEPWQVTRYHSLHVTNIDQTPLIPTATTSDGLVNMAFRHATLPHYGVQFHPESIGSNHGWALLKAFCDVCQETKVSFRTSSFPIHKDTLRHINGSESSHLNGCAVPHTNGSVPRLVNGVNMKRNGVTNGSVSPRIATSNGISIDDEPRNGKTTILVYKVPDSHMEPQHVMDELLKDSPYRFWLDTSDIRTNAMSVLGQATERLEYWGQDAVPERRGVYVYENEGKEAQWHTQLDILTYLDREYSQPTNSISFVEYDETGSLVVLDTVHESADILPFSYRGGHVGYLGYEVRHDTADYLTKLEGGRYQPPIFQTQKPPACSTPTAALMKAERSYVYHHDQRQWYLVCHVQNDDEHHRQETMEWIHNQSRVLRAYDPSGQIGEMRRDFRPKTATQVTFTPNRSKSTYNRNFETCLEKIRAGESYELCLTNKLEASVKTRESPIDLYRVLRRRNPAPFSSFFDWNSRQQVPDGSSFAICCSSPERFVSVSPGPDQTMHVEAKPIKGTCARVLPTQNRLQRSQAEKFEDARRAQELRRSVKNRAENLMIVDLLRNDLSRVCRTGSVHVAKLMDIESFATVHQMVSTIRGTLDSPQQSAIATLRACFPGGSMTGAPKLRTMELLEGIEEGVPRGPYAGCLGYIGANGAMDMNIVIRTAVVTPLPQVGSWQVSVGAGGAITILSESEDEYEEMILKASAVVGAVEEWAGGATQAPEDAESRVQEDARPVVK